MRWLVVFAEVVAGKVSHILCKEPGGHIGEGNGGVVKGSFVWVSGEAVHSAYGAQDTF